MDSRKLLAVGAVPAVMALGALGFTSQQSSAQPNTASQTQTTVQQAKAQPAENKGADTDNVQQGDQTSPDKPGQAEQKEASGPDKDNVQLQQGDQNAPDDQGGPAESGK